VDTQLCSPGREQAQRTQSQHTPVSRWPIRLGQTVSAISVNGRRRITTRGLSATSVHHVHVAIGKALRDATRWELLSRNVASLADLPRPTRKERTLWTNEQVTTFLEATLEDRLGAAWVVFATTGLRRGELSGLRWRNVDLDAGTLTVSGARVSVRYKVVDSQPKTDKSRRTISLDPWVVKVLRTHRKRQLEERLAWPGWTDTDLVFVREDGIPVHPEYFTWLFQRTAKQLGLRILPFMQCATTTPPPVWRPGWNCSLCPGVLATPASR
jgi:integrase